MSSKLLLIAFSIALATGGFAKPCKYWCRTAEEKYYCCTEKMMPEKENSWTKTMAILIPHLWFASLGWPKIDLDEHYHWEEKKIPEKQCPPERSACPRSYDWWYDPPTPCHSDDECSSSAKCCFDICLDHKTCKPAEFS